MHKRLKIIHKFYNNLEYNKISKEKASNDIRALADCKVTEIINDPTLRYSFIADIIKDNLSIFQSVCEHVDTITDIIHVLNEIDAVQKNKEERMVLGCMSNILFSLVMVMIHSACKEDIIQTFVDEIFLKNVKLDIKVEVNNELLKLRTLINNSHNEIILLQDADLYAVINSLKIARKFSLDKIWVQDQIKEKFLLLLKENFHHTNFPIYVFRFKEELLASNCKTNNCNINIISIWSENIIAAKNLAFSLYKDIVYINTYMDSTLNLYDVRMCSSRLYDSYSFCVQNKTDFICKMKQGESVDNTRIYPMYNLFYDGTWKRINETTYMIHKGSKWACITSMDIKNCIASANKGFEIWSTMPFNSRMQVLSNFALTLQCNSKSLLANVILKLIENSYLIKNNSLCYEKGRFEVTIQHQPIGFIFLKEENEITLFSRLIEILMAGNSVIVLCDANSCNLTPYCNMFTTAEIPPGVINMLPIESLENWEAVLFGTSYAHYILNFFLINRSNNIVHNYDIFRNLCLLKKIVVAIE